MQTLAEKFPTDKAIAFLNAQNFNDVRAAATWGVAGADWDGALFSFKYADGWRKMSVGFASSVAAYMQNSKL